MKGTISCITGIDTDIGKTVVTGLLARALSQQGESVITQKLVQTGCSGIAEDILRHREIMGIELLPEDNNGLTCPYVFQKPCSPHLAAELEQCVIDVEQITKASRTLAEHYDHVLVEGAGGLLVPLSRKMSFLDYLEKMHYPLILVSSPRLGSINHTLSALELAQKRGLQVTGIVYNCYVSEDAEIEADSRRVFAEALVHYGYPPTIIDIEKRESLTAGSDFPPGLERLIVRGKR